MAKGDFPTPERKRKIEQYYKNKIKGVEIMFDNVWDPHNVAAVLRTADGLGIEKAHLYYTYNEFPDLKRKGKKSSSSANKWIRLERINNLSEFAKQKRKEGYAIIGTALVKGAKNLTSFKFPKKCLIIFGNENKGMSPETLEICDEFLFIPMAGMVQSYNISVSAAMAMYELFKQRGKGLKLRK